ncbi:MAG: DUF5309 domain-containing protein [Oscillospiraceae bacterium]|nr:DUF5309 domain-containing protein [Oscillospiraceae bacterium]
MANYNATGTTWNLPNYAGQLYSATPADTPFLNLIAGKAVKSDNYQFPTGVEYAIAPAAQPSISEEDSASAPQAISYGRSQEYNVTQIFHEKISVNYTKLASGGRLSGAITLGGNGGETILDELEFQTARALEKIARDIEYTFINGVYQQSTSAATANRTRGILAAAGTVISADSAALTAELLGDAFKQAYDAGATFSDMVLICGAGIKQQITNIYSGQWGFSAPPTRSVGGSNIMQIETDLGLVSVLLSRFVPAGTLIGADVSCIRPVEQDVPGKGNFFREQLAKTGAAEEHQIFGHIGLDHGPGWKHFVVSDILV